MLHSTVALLLATWVEDGWKYDCSILSYMTIASEWCKNWKQQIWKYILQFDYFNTSTTYTIPLGPSVLLLRSLRVVKQNADCGIEWVRKEGNRKEEIQGLSVQTQLSHLGRDRSFNYIHGGLVCMCACVYVCMCHHVGFPLSLFRYISQACTSWDLGQGKELIKHHQCCALISHTPVRPLNAKKDEEGKKNTKVRNYIFKKMRMHDYANDWHTMLAEFDRDLGVGRSLVDNLYNLWVRFRKPRSSTRSRRSALRMHVWKTNETIAINKWGWEFNRKSHFSKLSSKTTNNTN